MHHVVERHAAVLAGADRQRDFFGGLYSLRVSHLMCTLPQQRWQQKQKQNFVSFTFFRVPFYWWAFLRRGCLFSRFGFLRVFLLLWFLFFAVLGAGGWARTCPLTWRYQGCRGGVARGIMLTDSSYRGALTILKPQYFGNKNYCEFD